MYDLLERWATFWHGCVHDQRKTGFDRIMTTDDDQQIAMLSQRVLATPRKGKRRLVALVGTPASGKSTLAASLSKGLCRAGCITAIVPMDGFHLHNQILAARGILDRKGSPPSFDAAGFLHLVDRLHADPEVLFPEFDRSRDIAIAGAGVVSEQCDTVVIEGNYLLLNAPVWRGLAAHWDLSIMLDVPLPVLHERLIKRWVRHGLTRAQAKARTLENDLPNAELVIKDSLAADLTVK